MQLQRDLLPARPEFPARPESGAPRFDARAHAELSLSQDRATSSKNGNPRLARQLGIETQQSRSDYLGGLFLCCLAPVLWGGNFVVARALSGELSPEWLNFSRWCIAALVLLPICAAPVARNLSTILRGIGPLFVLAVLGVIGFNLVLYEGLKSASVTKAAIAFSVTPFMIMAISASITRRTPRLIEIAAMGVSLGGMLLLHLHGSEARFTGDRGEVIVLAAALIWSLYCIAIKHLAPELPATACFSAQIVIAIFLQLPILLLLGQFPDFQNITSGTWAGMTYLGICASAIAFLAWHVGLRRIGPHHAGIFMNLTPVSGILLSLFFLGEQVSAGSLLGICVVLAGVVTLSAIPLLSRGAT